jgi:hypothetical protein
MKFTQIPYALALSAAMFLSVNSLPAQTKCTNDRKNLTQLENQLQEDNAWLARNCANNLSQECQQEGPGMRTAIYYLNEEINAARGQVVMDCNPPPPPPPIAVIAIEVTQAIQDLNESVPLIAGKQTWARVYLSTTTSNPITVTGTLQIQNSQSAVTTVQASAPVTLTLGTPLQQMRQTLTGSLNFLIPPAFTVADGYTFTLASISTQQGGALGCSNCRSQTQSVTFVSAPPMRLLIVGIQYTLPPNNTIVTPRSIDYALLNSWLTRAYPISQLISSQTTLATSSSLTTLFGGGSSTGGCAATNAQLATFRTTQINQATNPVDPRTHYYGMVLVNSAAPNGGYMRGCTPGGLGYISSGPTGSPTGPVVPINVTGDTDASFGDWYGGHELGHSFGRLHPSASSTATTGFCGSGPPLDPNYPYPNGQISDNQGDLTGLDVGDPTNSIPMTVIPGASDFDIMTYCNQPQWLSDYTYEAILQGGVQQDPSGNGPGQGLTSRVGRFVSIVASINLTKKTGKIEFAQTIERAALAPPKVENQVSLRLVDTHGKVIGEYAANVGINSDIAPGEDVTGLVDAVIPYSSEAAKLELYFENVRLDQRNISKTAPVVRKALAVSPGTLVWEARQTKGFSLTYYVQASPDGERWETIAMSLTKPTLKLSSEQLRSYRRFRVVANNGFNNSVPVEIALGH